MYIVSIVGTRPQFVKLAPINEELANRGIKHTIIHSGQHYDYNMSDIFFKEFGLPSPSFNLNVGSGTHAEQTGNTMIAIEPILKDLRPDIVLVYGDTNTTLAAAIVARKLGIPVGHVEAGCRSGQESMPEEINRVVTDHLSQLHFCPTDKATHLLRQEGIVGYNTGDVMVDVFNKIQPIIPPHVGGAYYVATIHRSENADSKSRMEHIFEGFGSVSTPIIFPIHPRTKKTIDAYSIQIPRNVILVPPTSHLEMLSLIKHADVVITDSGGIQKEAFLLQTQCITVRKSTEWRETLLYRWNTLTEPESLSDLLREYPIHPKHNKKNPFGDGHAAKNIVDILEECHDESASYT